MAGHIDQGALAGDCLDRVEAVDVDAVIEPVPQSLEQLVEEAQHRVGHVGSDLARIALGTLALLECVAAVGGGGFVDRLTYRRAAHHAADQGAAVGDIGAQHPGTHAAKVDPQHSGQGALGQPGLWVVEQCSQADRFTQVGFQMAAVDDQ
ncbi:hypothetical protein [Salinicola tamaricis]|uniref:hypothetical protein n=1 Tax=Salinicola tamaricis TaxID=1771309 RepID=UPI0030F45437